jgi:hypothetical protein
VFAPDSWTVMASILPQADPSKSVRSELAALPFSR